MDTITVTQTVKGRTVDTVFVETGEHIDTYTDAALAQAAGYSSSHFGFHVIRPEDETHRATVVLYTD